MAHQIMVHLRSTQVLAAYCWDRGLMAFKFRPKHHCLVHLAIDCTKTRVNPRAYHCFNDESFLGKLKSIARKCHGASMTKRVLQRYVISFAMFLRCES